jgi:antitoxin ParD1/3/4
MARSMTVNVRVNGPLGDLIADNVGEPGTYDNVSEYVRDLIRKDKDRAEAAQFERLKAELGLAFAAPDDSYSALTADEVIARYSARKGA